MSLPRPASPVAAWSDFRNFLRQRSRHQLIAAGLAVAMPVVILTGFYFDAKSQLKRGEEIIYVKNWPATRTDAEIKAQQKIDQARKEKALAERQRQYKEVARRLGM